MYLWLDDCNTQGSVLFVVSVLITLFYIQIDKIVPFVVLYMKMLLQRQNIILEECSILKSVICSTLTLRGHGRNTLNHLKVQPKRVYE